jgi:HK97 family phage prohead protease
MEFEKPEVRIPDYIRNLSDKAERRFCVSGIERRSGEPNSPKVFRGYAALFNSLSEDFGGWREKIAPGFFDNVLGNDVRALRDHTPSLILGRTVAGTLKIGVDERGLWYEYTDPDTSYSRDLAISIERGDVNQSSFAFALNDEGSKWERQKDGSYIRTLLAASELFDVSPVTYPAYRDTSVGERSLKKAQIPDGIVRAHDLLDMDRELMQRDLNRLKIA